MRVTKSKCAENVAAELFRAVRIRNQVEEGGRQGASFCSLSPF